MNSYIKALKSLPTESSPEQTVKIFTRFRCRTCTRA
uniref:Uncharacterized protein n=1 Tax=Arundo donax TaxID=35708 RepID=A0A0A9AED2_ARUDO